MCAFYPTCPHLCYPVHLRQSLMNWCPAGVPLFTAERAPQPRPASHQAAHITLAGIVRLQCVCACCLSDCVAIGPCSPVWDSAGWRLRVNPSFLSGSFLLRFAGSCCELQLTEMISPNFETRETWGGWVQKMFWSCWYNYCIVFYRCLQLFELHLVFMLSVNTLCVCVIHSLHALCCQWMQRRTFIFMQNITANDQ